MSFFRKLLHSQKSLQHPLSKDNPPHVENKHTALDLHDKRANMSINLLVVNWNATSVDRQSLELRIDPDVKLHPFLRLVFERLEMDKLGLHEDQMELWVLDAPDVDNLSNIRYDGCDRRLTRLSGENRSLDSYVNPSDQNLVFIGRPSIIDINGRLSNSQLYRLVQADRIHYPRLDALKALWGVLRERHIVHARGTPACGKTTLARSFERYMRWQEPNLKVLGISWTDHYGVAGSYIEHLKAENRAFFQGMNDHISLTTTRYLLIIDEAQNSYRKQDFWLDYIKTISETNFTGKPYVLLLSSWGSPSEQPITHVNSTAATFEPEKRMSIQPSKWFPIGLYFTKEEFCGFVRLYAEEFEVKENGKFKMIFNMNTVDFLYEFTSGHPGMSSAMMTLIEGDSQIRARMKNFETIKLAQIQELIQKPDLVTSLRNSSTGIERAIPSDEDLRDPTVAVAMLTVLRDGFSRETEKNSFQIPAATESSLMTVYKRGYLQADLDDTGTETVFVIPTRFHFMHYEKVYQRMQGRFPTQRYPTPLELSLDVVKHFSPESLRKGGRRIGVAAKFKATPYESQYQDEFYRACHMVLGGGYLTSEWISDGHAGGRIDFIVKDVRWGIEVIRDSSALAEHLGRFKKGGAYWESIEKKELEKFIVLDFTEKSPTEKWQDAFLYRIVFDDNFNRYKVYDQNLQVLSHSVLLKNQ